MFYSGLEGKDHSDHLETVLLALNLFQFFPRRPHGWDLLAGQGLEGLCYQVRVRCNHLFPSRGLHHVSHVTSVDKLNGLENNSVTIQLSEDPLFCQRAASGVSKIFCKQYNRPQAQQVIQVMPPSPVNTQPVHSI